MRGHSDAGVDALGPGMVYGRGMLDNNGVLGHGGQTLGFQSDGGYLPGEEITLVMWSNSAVNLVSRMAVPGLVEILRGAADGSAAPGADAAPDAASAAALPAYVAGLQAVYGPPSQEAFGSAVFYEPAATVGDLPAWALENVPVLCRRPVGSLRRGGVAGAVAAGLCPAGRCSARYRRRTARHRRCGDRAVRGDDPRQHREPRRGTRGAGRGLRRPGGERAGGLQHRRQRRHVRCAGGRPAHDGRGDHPGLSAGLTAALRRARMKSFAESIMGIVMKNEQACPCRPDRTAGSVAAGRLSRRGGSAGRPVARGRHRHGQRCRRRRAEERHLHGHPARAAGDVDRRHRLLRRGWPRHTLCAVGRSPDPHRRSRRRRRRRRCRHPCGLHHRLCGLCLSGGSVGCLRPGDAHRRTATGRPHAGQVDDH